MTRRTITPKDPEWPRQLSDLRSDQPRDMRVEGLPLRAPKDKTVAVVGTRHPSASGIEAAGSLGKGLAEAGFTIVSGLAMGIDAVAHRAALETTGYTIAVLGTGLDIVYPQRNAALRREIDQSGTVITEYHDSAPPTTHSFPRRNRIIAAVSRAVVFVEGGLKSGGRITARIGFDLERPVFAVPGGIYNPKAAGTNLLIKQGLAKLITGLQDVLDDLAPELIWDAPDDPFVPPQLASVDAEELRVLELLEDRPVKPEAVRRHLEMSFGQTALTLTRLEARGWVVRKQGGFVLTATGLKMRRAALEAL